MSVLSKTEFTTILQSALLRNGIPQTLSNRAADVCAKEIWSLFAGVRIYLAKGRHTSSRQSAAILVAFDGSNHLELAQRYGVSVRRIEQIVEKALKARVTTP